MTMTPTFQTITVRRGRGYRIIRRVKTYQPTETPLQRLWKQIWAGGNAEQVHARHLYRQHLEEQQQEQHLHRIFLP